MSSMAGAHASLSRRNANLWGSMEVQLLKRRSGASKLRISCVHRRYVGLEIDGAHEVTRE